MSGVTLTPLQIERNRINRLKSELGQQNKRNNKLRNEIKSQEKNWNKRLRSVNNLIEQHQKDHQRSIRSLRSDLKSAEQRHQQHMQRLESDFNRALTSQKLNLEGQIDDLGEWTEGQLNEQRNEYLEITNRQQLEISEINTELAGLRQKEANKQTIVQERLEDLKLLLGDLKNLPHERFAPGEVAPIEQKIALAEGDMELLPESANAMIVDSYEQLVAVRAKVLTGHHAYELLHAQVVSAVQTLLTTLNEDSIDVDDRAWEIDHWTDDSYTAIRQEAQRIHDLLEQEKNNLRTKEVEDAQVVVQRLMEAERKAVDQAIKHVLAARERRNMGVKIVKGIAGDFRIVDGNGFENGDPRNAYIVKVKTSNNPGATELVAIISPTEVEGGQVQNVLAINSTDHFMDEENRRARSHEIAQKLNTEGVLVGNTICHSDDHFAELEGNAVRQITQRGSGGLPQHVKEQLKLR